MRALLIIDLQNDFMPQGPLGVSGADQLAVLINSLQPYFSYVVTAQDWHPLNHISFAFNHRGKKVGDTLLIDGVIFHLWPLHCVQNTQGAQLVEHLDQERISKRIYKGEDPHIDSYSAFFDNAKKSSTGLEIYLKKQRIQELYITGIATEYCVIFSALDALELGFKVTIIADACRAVDPFCVEQVLEHFCSQGGQVILARELLCK